MSYLRRLPVQTLGCTQGQGYGIARPMMASELGEWITAFEHNPPWGRADPEPP